MIQYSLLRLNSERANLLFERRRTMAVYSKEDWQMHPIGGNTGKAFMGVRHDEKVFFKRNTSPFIAALSATGIAPKLKWTQRTYSGDILTAQEWKDGSLLTKENMQDEAVIQLIKDIHESTFLLNRLKFVEGKVCRPLDLIDLYFQDLAPSLHTHLFFNKIISHLEDSIDDDFYDVDYVVCHGDLNHNNFLVDSDQQLFLVDWDNVRIADPISDITLLLCQYYNPSEWMDWFELYDFEITESFSKRVTWYSLMSCLFLAKQYFNENRHYKLNETILLLKNIFENQPEDI